MTLSSASTLADVEAAYDDNASYRQTGSVTAASEFVTACRILLRRYASRLEDEGGKSLERQLSLLQSELEEAQNWLSSTATGGRVIDVDFSEYRG